MFVDLCAAVNLDVASGGANRRRPSKRLDRDGVLVHASH